MHQNYPPTRVHFTVRTDHCLHVVCRILGLFAQRDLAVERLTVERLDDRYVIEFIQCGIDDRTAENLADRIRNMVRVRAVALTYPFVPAAVAA